MNVRIHRDVRRVPLVLTRLVHSNVTVDKGFCSMPLVEHAKARCNAYTYLPQATGGSGAKWFGHWVQVLPCPPAGFVPGCPRVNARTQPAGLPLASCLLNLLILFELFVSLAMKRPKGERQEVYTHSGQREKRHLLDID